MRKLDFSKGSYVREVAKTPVIPLHNRFIETVPTLTDGPVSAIARPALRKLVTAGEGPVRGMGYAPGIFGDKLFVVSGTNLYTVDPTTGAATDRGAISTQALGDVSFAPVAQISEETPSRMFFCDNGVLYYYTENAPAEGRLENTGGITNGDVVEINGVYYEFTNASVDAGTPAGTSGAPWLVAMGLSDAAAFQNLFWAINADEGTAGTDYSTATTPNAFVRATQVTATDLVVAALVAGTAGNAYTTTETGTGLAWQATTLAGGGTTKVIQIATPGDIGAVNLTSINSYIIVVPVQEEALDTVGKFYWIEPGDDFIDPLDFANAERSSDKINTAITFRDQFWLFGRETTESWITTGDPNFPMQRYQGAFIDRGSWDGTAVKVRDSMVFVDDQGGVFLVGGGGAQRVSRPDIEERIRRGIQQDLAKLGGS